MLIDLQSDGMLPPGIHSATLGEIEERFGAANATRRRQFDLLTKVVDAGLDYDSIKRVLVWGSFASDKKEPGDLDFSLIVSAFHHQAAISQEHQRFLIPFAARRYYGVDRSFLLIQDYPFEAYLESMDFICRDRNGSPRGIIEIGLRGVGGVR